MTQKNTDYTKVNSFLIAGAIVVAAFAPGFYVAEPANGLTEEQVKTIVNDAVNGLKLSDADKVDYIYAEAFKEDSYEAYGETLALDELNSRDFKKDLLKVLENETGIKASIESYRDIEDVRILDVTTTIDVKDVKVTVEFKVDFFEDGDSDKDDAETAKYFVDFVVVDAASDDDDDREDAEVRDDFSFRFIKFYD